jgi:outer membrane protein assembly factor BamB
VLRRALIGGGIVVCLCIGALTAYVLEKRHESRNIAGSSTEEFVVPKPRPKPHQPKTQKPARTLAGVVWPVFGYGDERTKAPTEFRQRPPFRPVWTFDAPSLLEFPPVIAYDRAYIASLRGGIFALDVRTGKVAWRFRTKRCSAASPAVWKGIVIHTFMNPAPCDPQSDREGVTGQVIALDARTGKVIWNRIIGASETSPVVAHGLVYVGDWRGYVYAFDAKNGRLKWRYRATGEVKAGVAVAGNRLYVGAYDGHMYALNAHTGRELWRSSAQGRLGGIGDFYATPAVAYGRVYVGNTDGKVYSYGATSGQIRWSYSTGGYVYSSPAVWRERVYVGSHDDHLYCFDAATGRLIWRFAANGWVPGGPTIIDGVVYFSTATGRTYALDARSGKQLWFWRDGQYTPVAADGTRLYIVGYHKLYAMIPKR